MALKYLLTGGTSGIGLAFAKSLSNTDSDVTFIARNKEKIEKVLKDLIYKSSRYILSDLNFPDQIDKSINEAFLKDNYPDVFIYSAGSAKPITAKKASCKNILEVLNVNFISFAAIMRNLLRYKPKEKLLKVIAISSKAVDSPFSGNGIYAASKAALEAYIRCTACEYGKQDLCINALSLGWVDTPMANNSFLALQHENFDEWLRSGPQPEGLIPVAKVVKKIKQILSPEFKNMSGLVFDL